MFNKTKKIICSFFMALAMVVGLASCDKKEEKPVAKKVSGDEVLGLVMTDVMQWDLSQGIAIEGKQSTKFGGVDSTSSISLKLSVSQMGELNVEAHEELLPGFKMDMYVISNVLYLNLDGVKITQNLVSEETPMIAQALNAQEEDPFEAIMQMFDFYKLSETKYYITAKTEFLTMMNQMIESTLVQNSFDFLKFTIGELRLDLEFSKDLHLKGIGLKAKSALKIEDQEAKFEVDASVSINTNNALPALPADSATYLPMETVIGNLVASPIHASLNLNVAFSNGQKMGIALSIDYSLDTTKMSPVVMITIDEDTMGLTALFDFPTAKYLKIALDEETQGFALTILDKDETELAKISLQSTINPEPTPTPNEPLQLVEGEENPIDVTLIKNLLIAILFDHSVVSKEDHLQIAFGNKLSGMINEFIASFIDLEGMEAKLAQVMQAIEDLKTTNPDYEKDPTYQVLLAQVKMMQAVKGLVTMGANQFIIDVRYPNDKTNVSLELKNNSDSLKLTAEVDLSLAELMLLLTMATGA